MSHLTLIKLDPIQYQKEMAEIVLTAAVEGASLLSETVTDVIAPAVVEAAGACADRIRENPMAASLSVSAALHAAKKLKGTVFTHNKIDESYQNAAFKTGKYTHEHRLANIEKHLALAQQREAKMMIVQMNGFKNGTAWLDNIDKFHTPGICQYCSKCKKRPATHGKEDAEKPELCQECVGKKRNGDEFVKDFREQTVDYLYNNVVAFHRDSENNKAQLQILDPETETRVSIRTATVVSDLAAANKELVAHVTKQDSRNEDGIAENRKMAMLMLKQLAEQSTLQSLAMAKGDERAHIAQEAQMKAAEQTNNILLEVMKQNKNVAGNLSTIEKMADMNKASTIQLRMGERKANDAEMKAVNAERKAEDAERKADEAEIKAEEAEIKAENAEKEAVVAKNIAQKSITEAEGATATANRYKRDCEKAVQELNELD
ncbi:MAG: hypothetical protein V3W20_12340, partial [Candidatus Neomarinimicrobiota bacterium]